MTMILHPCMKCGRYTSENEARYLGENECELWLCPDCDAVPTVTEVAPENIALLRAGSLALKWDKSTGFEDAYFEIGHCCPFGV